MYEEVELPDGEKCEVANRGAEIGDTPGGLRWIGPPLGAHNTEVYRIGLASPQPSWHA